MMVLAGLAGLGVAAALVLFAFEDSIVFFYSPSDVAEQQIQPERRFRLGGLVEEGSLSKADDGLTFHFSITDFGDTIPVVYKGFLPDLFREGQGVVAEGTLDAQGVFVASDVLAKHDENYMPPEVSESLKKQGHWREGQTQ
jgi:cytochrome c-type biogenesis protein CcmE